MQFTIMIYGEDGAFERLPEAVQAEVMAGHRALQEKLAAKGPFASAKLMPASHAVTLHPLPEPGREALVTDGPFAETKEQFLGFYAAEFEDLDDALRHARLISSPYARLEVRPVSWAGGVLAGGGA